MNQFHRELLDISIQTSRFESRRDYISLSNIIKPVEELISDFQNGYEAGMKGKLKCRMGYQMEASMLERIMLINGTGPSKEIVVPGANGLIKGHCDFTYQGMPGDCKSFLKDEWLPEFSRLSSKITWQMNAYMLYSGQTKSLVVCESRESGLLKTIPVHISESICEQIRQKVDIIKSCLAERGIAA